MNSDTGYPRLVPPDDRFPGHERLFRSPHDLPLDQFSLLAAAWAEGALSGESLNEFESVIAADTEKGAFAESFRKLRLKPGTEKWDGRHKLLRPTPGVKKVRQMIIYTVAAAAAIIAIMTIRPVAEHQVVDHTPHLLPGVTVTADITRPAIPGIQTEREKTPAESLPVITQPATLVAPAENEVIKRDRPLEIGIAAETPAISSEINAKELMALQFNEIPSPSEAADERSWIVTSLAALSKSRPKEDKPVSGYNIAGSLVKSVNSILGWEMELEKISTEQGEPVAVSFSSGLLTILSPVKKSSE